MRTECVDDLVRERAPVERDRDRPVALLPQRDLGCVGEGYRSGAERDAAERRRDGLERDTARVGDGRGETEPVAGDPRVAFHWAAGTGAGAVRAGRCRRIAQQVQETGEKRRRIQPVQLPGQLRRVDRLERGGKRVRRGSQGTHGVQGDQQAPVGNRACTGLVAGHPEQFVDVFAGYFGQSGRGGHVVGGGTGDGQQRLVVGAM